MPVLPQINVIDRTEAVTQHFLAKSLLKMLCLYLDTLLIGQQFCNMLNILNELTLQKGITNVQDK